VLGSAAPMAAVGGCCPLVVPAAPAVGPAPASREAMSLVRLSISVVQALLTELGNKSAHQTSWHATGVGRTIQVQKRYVRRGVQHAPYKSLATAGNV
jgi:hypothetical protein